jgi:hypothetical protein
VSSGSTTEDDTLSLRIDLNSVLESGDRLEIYRSVSGAVGVDSSVELMLGTPTFTQIQGNDVYHLEQDLRSFESISGGDEKVTFTYRAVVVDAAGNSTELFSNYRVTVDFDD